MAWESWNGILQVRFFSEKFPFKSFQTVKFKINHTILGWIDLKKVLGYNVIIFKKDPIL